MELHAKPGHYLTQVAEVADHRIYAKYITGTMLVAEHWRDATEAEKAAHDAKAELLEAIKNYDASSEVNIFFMAGTPMWLDKATRAGLMLRFQAEIAAGLTNTALWYGGQQYQLQLTAAMQMLYALELYASQCYDATHAHLASVEKLQTVDDVKAYDYTVGYPPKLQF